MTWRRPHLRFARPVGRTLSVWSCYGAQGAPQMGPLAAALGAVASFGPAPGSSDPVLEAAVGFGPALGLVARAVLVLLAPDAVACFAPVHGAALESPRKQARLVALEAVALLQIDPKRLIEDVPMKASLLYHASDAAPAQADD